MYYVYTWQRCINNMLNVGENLECQVCKVVTLVPHAMRRSTTAPTHALDKLRTVKDLLYITL